MSRRMLRMFDSYISRVLGEKGRYGVMIGVSAGGTLALFQHKFSEIMDCSGNPSDIQSPHKLFLLRLLYGRTRSRLMGTLMNRQISPKLRAPVMKAIAQIGRVNLDEIRYPLESYKCVGHLFARTLKDEARPIECVDSSSMISPVDAEIVNCGTVSSNRLEQIKGASYNLSAFLGISESEVVEKNLRFVVLYLAPTDYHHFHSPCKFKLLNRRHFPGETLPVFKRFAKKVNDLFSVNERVVLSGSWTHGDLHYAAVAAYNVGNIRLAHEPDLRTNQMRAALAHLGGDIDVKNYAGQDVMHFGVGEHVGEFRLGSTVVLVFEAPKEFEWNVAVGSKVSVGHRLGGSNPKNPGEKLSYAYYAINSTENGEK